MIGPFGIFLDEQTGLWQLAPLPLGDKKGGGGGPGLGVKNPRNVNALPASPGVATRASREDHKHDVDTAAPVAVRGVENLEGSERSLARSDHEHRLELEVRDAEGTLIGARPRIAFYGPGLTISDDPVGDVVTVTIATDGLANATAATNLPLDDAGFTPVLSAPFTVPAGTWDVELYASATVSIMHPGTIGADAVGAVFSLNVDATPLTTRQLVISSLDIQYSELSLAAHGSITLGEGSYTAALNGSAMLVTDASVEVRWRYLGVRLFRASV